MDADTDVSERQSLFSTPLSASDCKSSTSATDPSIMGLSHHMSSSTPLLHTIKNGLLKQKHALNTCDSGFSEYSLNSASVASLDTPCLPGASFSQHSTTSLSESDSTEFIPRNPRRSWPLRSRKLSFQSPDSPHESPELDLRLRYEEDIHDRDSAVYNTSTDSAEFFHTHHRRSWPLRSRKLSFRSPDALLSPELGLPLRRGDHLYQDCANKFESFQTEDELTKIMSKPESIAQRGLLCQALHRSRSSSRSPQSSLSADDLEHSFQEMSLEESSSDSAQQSPTPLDSSSPVFTFNHQLILNDSIKAQDDRKLSNLSWETAPSHILLRGIEENNDHQSSHNIELLKETEISTVCCSPKPEIYVTSPCSARAEKSIENSLAQDVNQVDFISSLSLVPAQESTSQPSQRTPALGFHETGPNHLVESSSSRCHRSKISSSFASDFKLIKSPTKRSCCPQDSVSESISPQKMRKVRSRSTFELEQSAVKRDLFGCLQNVHEAPNSVYDSKPLVTSVTGRRKINFRASCERLPQFVNIGSSEVVVSKVSVKATHPATPVKWKECEAKNGKERSEEQADPTPILVQRICLKFSPPNPCRLIGRHVGVKKFDIVYELKERNLMECVEIILAYIPDCDLVRIVEVSDGWRTALLLESNAQRRYKNLLRKSSSPRKNRSQAHKENVVDKLQQKENVPMTSSKGPLTSIQSQFVGVEVLDAVSLPHQLDLQCEDLVRNCPHCQCRAVVLPSQDRATCMSEKCAYDFCTKCFFPFHCSTRCRPLFNCASKNTLAGTKKSKKNLKRLKFL